VRDFERTKNSFRIVSQRTTIHCTVKFAIVKKLACSSQQKKLNAKQKNRKKRRSNLNIAACAARNAAG